MKSSTRQFTVRIVISLLTIPTVIYGFGVILGMAGGGNWRFGYYGQFNRVKAVIEDMPEFTIIDSWQHHDVTMEDFGFTVADSSGAAAGIDFYENSPQKALSGKRDIAAFVRQSFDEQARAHE